MSDAPARVVFTTGFSRRYTGGVTEFAVAAKTLRGVSFDLADTNLN